MQLSPLHYPHPTVHIKLCFLHKHLAEWQPVLQLHFTTWVWNFLCVKVNCPIVNKQHIRYGLPVWSYTLNLHNNIFSNSNFSNSLQYLFLYYIITHILVCIHQSFKICQNVAERNLFYLKRLCSSTAYAFLLVASKRNVYRLGHC